MPLNNLNRATIKANRIIIRTTCPLIRVSKTRESLPTDKSVTYIVNLSVKNPLDRIQAVASFFSFIRLIIDDF